MTEIEARVEAAAASLAWGRKVYIVNKRDHPDKPLKGIYDGNDDFAHVLDNAPPVFLTWYEHGAERGEGIRPPASKYKPVANDTDDSDVPVGSPKEKKPRATKIKQPLVLEEKPLKLTDLEKLEVNCIAVIGKQKWVVSVRSAWALQSKIMEQANTMEGLILVIKGQGYYMYPKKMWKEFENVMNSNTYKNTGTYSQSILPSKFEKYFKKF